MSKILIELENVVKRYGDRTVLALGRLALREGDRVGLIGENGAGKSTLLGIIAGSLAPDGGVVRRYAPVAVIRQHGAGIGDISGLLQSQFHTLPGREGLSGGEQTRRRIAAALSEDAPLLLADEPTSDLDAEGVERLTEQLKARSGALLLVSHDRALLNALCGRIWHLEAGHIREFPGGYDAFQAELDRERARQQFEYDQYRAEVGRLRASAQRQAEWAASVKKAPKRMGNSEARLHTREYTNAVLGLSHARQKLQARVEKLERKERPRDLPDIRMALGAAHPIAARVALTARVKQLRAGKRTLLYEAALTLPTGSRTALMGGNGCGKSTLLRALMGECAEGVVFRGDARWNPAARVGRFDQDHGRLLDPDRTALENARAASDLPEATARTVLARLNLPGDAVFRPVGVLSGGERAKVALARLMLGDYNLLILDEPTNHLDVFTLRALEALLAGYAGTLLLVSHDAAFTEAVATRTVRFEGTSLSAFEGPPAAWAAEQRRDRTAEDRALAVTALEMRLAALAARMAAPRRGDDPRKLTEEYDDLARRLRELKRSQEAGRER